MRNKLVALILGPQGMGLMSLFNSTTKLVGDSTNFGIAMSGVRNISEAYDAGDAQRLNDTVLMVRSWCMITAIFGMLLCALLSPWLSRFTFLGMATRSILSSFRQPYFLQPLLEESLLY